MPANMLWTIRGLQDGKNVFWLSATKTWNPDERDATLYGDHYEALAVSKTIPSELSQGVTDIWPSPFLSSGPGTT